MVVCRARCSWDNGHDGAQGLYAVSGRTGALVWSVSGEAPALVDESNMYTAQLIRDVDADDVPDFVVAHGGDPLKEPGAKGPGGLRVENVGHRTLSRGSTKA